MEIGCFVPETAVLQPLLAESAARHNHLCPRQVLGVRLGLCGLRLLGLVGGDYLPRFENASKRLLTIVETDGCGADGVAVATRCFVGRRTLRVLDFGKMAATLVDTWGELSPVRLWPHPEARLLAQDVAEEAQSRWHAYLAAYQHIPDDQLLRAERVTLTQSVAEIISRPEARVLCANCGEEVRNEREVVKNGRLLCRPCAGESYYG